MSQFNIDELTSLGKQEKNVKDTYSKNNGKAVKLPPDTPIFHNGVLIGTLGTVEDGLRCDCPHGHLHSDGLGEDYAHTVRLSGGDVGISCSGDSCNGLFVSDTLQQRDESQKSPIQKANTESYPSPRQALKNMQMTKEEKERAMHMVFFLESLIPQGYHIIIYGAAGSGKTTILLHLCHEIAKSHKDAEIFYLYLDGQVGMAGQYMEHLEKNGLSDRLNILTKVNIDEAFTLIEKTIETKEIAPQNLIVVLDTLKYLNPNINNKDANVKAMQRIKKLTSKGITFISLHHTNKDGNNYSGTADIEQDGDAMLKIVTALGDDPHTRVSTIQEGGRVRYFMEPKSFIFTQGRPDSVKQLDEVLDPAKLEQQEADSHAIFIIRGILNKEGKTPKTELEKLLKIDDDFDYGEKDRKRILKRYKDIHWKVHKGGERNVTHFYSAIDNTSEMIESLNHKIGMC